jgi:hypothetical protein
MNTRLNCLSSLKERQTMAGEKTWGSILAAAALAACAPNSERRPSATDMHETTDGAVASAIHCATDLDLMTASSPELAWTALQAETTASRVAVPAGLDRSLLEQRGRVEVARRLQAVLDSRAAVDRLDAHAGPWGAPQDPGALAEHVRSVSAGLCRTRDAAQALARRSLPAGPGAMSHLLTVEGARD